MICRRPLTECFLVLLTPLISCAAAAVPAEHNDTRTFNFVYSATIAHLQPGQETRVWVPIAPSDHDQQSAIVSKRLPNDAHFGRETKYANQMAYFKERAGADGSIAISLTYRVTRSAASEEDDAMRSPPPEAVCLQRDALVPVGGKSLFLIAGQQLPADPMQLGHRLYDVVDDHMQYRKDKPGYGRGDSDWACESGFGNCTDFHSVFMSLARANHLPVLFQIGFPLPQKPGNGPIAGYHCWAWFHPADHGWVPVDISEANKHPDLRDFFFGHLDANRFAFTTGRDLVLEPKQDGPPLNYFVFPYVEVDQKPYPAGNVICKMSFEDIENAPKTSKADK